MEGLLPCSIGSFHARPAMTRIVLCGRARSVRRRPRDASIDWAGCHLAPRRDNVDRQHYFMLLVHHRANQPHRPNTGTLVGTRSARHGAGGIEHRLLKACGRTPMRAARNGQARSRRRPRRWQQMRVERVLPARMPLAGGDRNIKRKPAALSPFAHARVSSPIAGLQPAPGNDCLREARNARSAAHSCNTRRISRLFREQPSSGIVALGGIGGSDPGHCRC